MAISPDLLPGRRWLERLTSRTARRAACRDFLFDLLPRGGRAIEVGVFDGDFSERILALNEPSELHLVDPWFTKEDGSLYDGPAQHFETREKAAAALENQYQRVARRFAAELASGRVRLHRQLSHDAAPLFEDEAFDWVYIDASHYYDDVRNDIACYFPKIRRGGCLTGDDYGRRGFWDHGVTRAVDEFIAAGAVEVMRLHNHQYVLRKR